MGDPLYLLSFCSAVPAVHSAMAVCYGALYCIPLDLITLVYCVHTYPQQVPRVHTIGHTNRDWSMYYEYTSGNAVRCSAIQYTARPLHTVLQVPQLGTLGITAPHNRTYPWVVLCVVSAMPLVYSALRCLLYSMLLCTTYLYSITLAMLYAYTEVEDTLVSIMA